MLRQALVLVAVVPFLATGGLCAAAAPRSPQTAAPTPGAFFISGRGWGHGVGLSQWGAYGFAQRGTGLRRILAHYYRGTVLARAPIARVRVLLADGRKAVANQVRGAVPRARRDGQDLSASRRVVRVRAWAAPEGGSREGQAAAREPLLFVPKRPLEYAGRAYRGQVQVNVGGARLQVVNNVGLEPYLYGVVPREVPNDWPAEALKARPWSRGRTHSPFARPARSISTPTRAARCTEESRRRSPRRTTQSTRRPGRVMYDRKVATTFFFSTSGGRAYRERPGRMARRRPDAVPVSVADPYDGASPHHTWGPRSRSPPPSSEDVRVPGRLVDARVAVNPSQRVSTVTFVNQRGDEIVVSGSGCSHSAEPSVHLVLFGVRHLARPTKPVDYGTRRGSPARRGGGSVTLEQRAGAVWEPAARLKLAPDGTITAVVRPLVTTDYG